MPTIAQGGQVDLSVFADSTIFVSNPGGDASISRNGVVVWSGQSGGYPYNAANAATYRINAIRGSVYYEVSTDLENVPALTQAEVASTRNLISAAGNQLTAAAVSGYSTGWLTAFASAERLGFRPTGLSGTASITVDASLDGVTVAQTLGVVSLTSADNGLQFYTPPLPIGYPFFRITVTADGGGTHAIGRGV